MVEDDNAAEIGAEKLEAATDRAARYAESAQKSICSFPDSEIKRALLWAPEFVVAREK